MPNRDRGHGPAGMVRSAWQAIARAVLLAAAGTIAALAFATPTAALEAAKTVDAAMQACRANPFDAFFRLYVQSPAVRERFSAEYLNTAPAGVRPDFIAKADYLEQFPLRVQGWNYLTPSLTAQIGADFVLLRTRRANTAWRVDWVNARFDAAPEDGRWVGVPLELRGVPRQLSFTASDDGCWRARGQVLAPKDTPFELGVQRLHCAIRAEDYRQELKRMVGAIADHPDDLELARELATCVALLNRIDAAIRRDAALATLQRQIDQRLAALVRRQSPAARKALAQDERRFRRSLLREQYLPAEGPVGEAELRDDLASRLASRLAFLDRIDTARKNVVGEWRNLAGGITIRRQSVRTVGVDASLVDPEFFAWSCEFNETMPWARTALSFTDSHGNGTALALRDGLLHVTQQGNGGDYCGANGSLGGVYFPLRPALHVPATLNDVPPP